MYENYPFWFTVLYKTWLPCGTLPGIPPERSTRLGIESIPSESECYPAKLAHGHISWLIQQGDANSSSTRVFRMSEMNSRSAVNHYNCPIVTSYAENIKNNVEELRNETHVDFTQPIHGIYQ